MSLIQSSARLIAQISKIGDRPSDDLEAQQHHHFLIYMALLMSVGGLLWGGLCLWFGFLLPSIIPFGYVLATGLNLWSFSRTKAFARARFVQVSLSLLLPVLFQLSLGGFINSGAVMLWSLLALGGALTFSELSLSAYWLAMYVVCTVACGLLDSYAHERSGFQVDSSSSTLFFVVNISVISSIFVILMLLILRMQRLAQRELLDANAQMKALTQELELRVHERTIELKETLSKTSAIIEQLADGLIAFNSAGQIQTYNHAFLNVVTQMGLSFDERRSPAFVEELKQRCLSTGEPSATELCVRQGLTFTASVYPLSLEEHQVELGCVVLVRDVSSERRLSQVEEQLAISEKMSALGTLAAGIAHEINNPLTYVMSNVEIIRDELEADVQRGEERAAELRELSTDALEGLERITKIIKELKGFMRSSDQSLSSVDLSKALSSALNLASAELKLKASVITSVPPALPSAYVDEQQLVQVFVNLLVNAAQAFEEQDLERNQIRVTLSEAADQMLQIEVRDNASGMPPEVARQIFDPFFTTKTAVGTGLGLAICHKIILGFNGTIDVESEEGQGTLFRIALPRFQPDRHQVRRPSGRSAKRAELDQIGKIIMIDDEPSVGQVVSRALGAERVELFTDGRQALKAIDAQHPDVIICDIMMPLMSGVEVYAALKERGLTSRTLMITGGSAREEVAEFISQEAPPILYKPFKPSELRERVCSIARATRSFQALELPDEALTQG